MSTREQRLDTLRKANFDDKFSAFLDQQLEALEAQIYRVEYPELKARSFIPLKSDVPAGAETFAYRVYDAFGEAVWLSNYQNKLPTASVRGEKIVGKVEGMGTAYHYSIQDLRAAAMGGMALESEHAEAARAALERKVDDVSAFGDSKRGFVGFANHPNPDLTNATGSWSNSATDPLVILADLMSFGKHVRAVTKEIFTPDTLLLPTSAYDAIATRLLSPTGSTRETILSTFLAVNPWIKAVSSWPKLETAGTGSGTRAIAYKRDAKIVQLVIPMEMLQHPPQLDGLAYQVPMEMRFGGVLVRQPKAIYYMDGV